MTVRDWLLGRLHQRGGKVAYTALQILGVDLPRSVKVGTGLQLVHGAVGLVVHESTVLGNDVRIFQGVTLGRSDQYKTREQLSGRGHIVVGDRVIIGAGAKILYRDGQVLSIGDDVVIGANSVLLSSIPPGEIWAGNPARRVSTNPNARRRLNSSD